MATIGSAKATLVNKIDSLTSSATAKDTIFLAKALKENTTHHSFTYQGAWATTTTYALDDVVTVNGNTYICILSHVAPASFAVGSHWDVMATKGTNGTNGTNGTDVGTGTAGQVLKTDSAGTGIEWGADEGGKFKSIIRYNYPNYSTTTSTSYVSIGGSQNYTVQNTGAKLFILHNFNFAQHYPSNYWAYVRLLIDGQSYGDLLHSFHTTGNEYLQTTLTTVMTSLSLTVGQVLTFQIQAKTSGNTIAIDDGNGDPSLIIMEIL
jgi:hypothetical protein